MVVGGPVFSHQYFSHGVPGAEPTCPPWRDHPLGDPLWGTNLISFFFISPLEKTFFDFNLSLGNDNF